MHRILTMLGLLLIAWGLSSGYTRYRIAQTCLDAGLFAVDERAFVCVPVRVDSPEPAAPRPSKERAT
ncbi:MAG: hypothetical protein NTW01_09430 [Gammaproteobacteria bacterium]|nr:hypothetical protein [Gammaproteobacteria bacterium]